MACTITGKSFYNTRVVSNTGDEYSGVHFSSRYIFFTLNSRSGEFSSDEFSAMNFPAPNWGISTYVPSYGSNGHSLSEYSENELWNLNLDDERRTCGCAIYIIFIVHLVNVIARISVSMTGKNLTDRLFISPETENWREILCWRSQPSTWMLTLCSWSIF